MTDRISAFTVILDEDVRDDCIEPTMTALRMVRGVAAVVPHVAEYDEIIARSRRDQVWVDALLRIVSNGPDT